VETLAGKFAVMHNRAAPKVVASSLPWGSRPERKSHEATEIHRTSRQLGSRMAVGGARAAAGRSDAAHWRSHEPERGRSRCTCLDIRLRAGTPGTRLDYWRQRAH